MHRFDPEIIAALAEGTLSSEEAAALEAEIAKDPSALAELTGQRVALAAIASSPRPTLSESERTHLRAAIADQLGLTPKIAAEAAPRRVPWAAIGIAATALAAIVAIVPITGLLSTGDGGNDDTLSFSELDSTTVVADAFDGSQAPAESSGDTLTAAGSDTTVGFAETTTTTASTTDLQRVQRELALVEVLAFVKDDPATLEGIAAPATDETACVLEARAWLESDDVSVFEYIAGVDPGSDEQTTTTTATSTTKASSTATTTTTIADDSSTTTDTSVDGDLFLVFFATPDGDTEAGPFVAFAPDDCGTPITVP